MSVGELGGGGGRPLAGEAAGREQAGVTRTRPQALRLVGHGLKGAGEGKDGEFRSEGAQVRDLLAFKALVEGPAALRGQQRCLLGLEGALVHVVDLVEQLRVFNAQHLVLQQRRVGLAVLLLLE